MSFENYAFHLTMLVCSVKGKAIPLQAWGGPEGSRRLRLPDFKTNRHMKVVRLSALRTGRLYLPGNIPGTHFCLRLSRPQGHSAAGRIMSMKNSNDTIGNRTRDLPTCSVVPQPTAPPRAPVNSQTTNEKHEVTNWKGAAKRQISWRPAFCCTLG
jgi:hypothetical protein